MEPKTYTMYIQNQMQEQLHVHTCVYCCTTIHECAKVGKYIHAKFTIFLIFDILTESRLYQAAEIIHKSMEDDMFVNMSINVF